MAKLYQITNTAGDQSFTIQPLGINGSNIATADSDVNLIGQGATLWGESFNESLLRVVENFSCPEKPGQPGVPQDESDLGTGLGINNPLPGQLWHNTTTGNVLVYGTGGGSPAATAGFQIINGVSVGTVEPSAPFEGDLWYDTSVPQLKIYNGSAFVSTAERYLLLDGTSTMTGDLDAGGNAIINVADIVGGSPAFGNQGANKNYVDQEITALTAALQGGLLDSQYVEVPGDTMTGTLTMQADVIMDTGTQVFVDDGSAGNPSLGFNNDAVQDTGLFTQGDGYINFTTNGIEKAKIEPNGTISVNAALNYETLVTDDDDIPNKKYVDDSVAAGAITGTVQMFAGTVLPSGYLWCQGQSLSTTTYADLFAVIGYTYGGSGASFNAPDFQGRKPTGAGATDISETTYGVGSIALGAKHGNWYSRLTSVNQMPSHNHGGGSHRHYQYRNESTVWRPMCTYPNNTPAVGGTGAGGPDDIYATAASNSTTEATCGRTSATSVVSSQGSSSNINTYDPALGINFIIKY